MTQVKICGITTPQALEAASGAGARFVGFVFYPPSPRHLDFDIAWNLARAVPTGVRSVALFVDPDDEQLDHILTGIQLDMIQLHGSETPQRVAEIKAKYNMPVIKAISISSADDLEKVEAYEDVADWLMFDAKPQKSDLPGGAGESFDWNILAGHEFKKPWMLAGGLTTQNVSEALNILSPVAVDISSGVESAPGIKDTAKIISFIGAAQKNN